MLRGAQVGANASIAGASVVRRGEYPSGFLYAGSPLQAVRPLAAEEQRAPGRHD